MGMEGQDGEGSQEVQLVNYPYFVSLCVWGSRQMPILWRESTIKSGLGDDTLKAVEPGVPLLLVYVNSLTIRLPSAFCFPPEEPIYVCVISRRGLSWSHARTQESEEGLPASSITTLKVA